MVGTFMMVAKRHNIVQNNFVETNKKEVELR